MTPAEVQKAYEEHTPLVDREEARLHLLLPFKGEPLVVVSSPLIEEELLFLDPVLVRVNPLGVQGRFRVTCSSQLRAATAEEVLTGEVEA